MKWEYHLLLRLLQLRLESIKLSRVVHELAKKAFEIFQVLLARSQSCLDFDPSKLMVCGWVGRHILDDLEGVVEFLDLSRNRVELACTALDSVDIGNDALKDFQAE